MGVPSSVDNKITKRGLLPLTLSDGTKYYQTCFYCANMVETIISPAAVLASSDVFYYWNQEGCKDPSVPGRLKFTSHDGLLLMAYTTAQRMYSPSIQIQSEFNVTGLCPPRHMM